MSEGIPLTVCPTANVAMNHLVQSVAAHPLLKQRAVGVLVTINSGDPGMLGVDLADEYVRVANEFACDLFTMEDFALASVEASWTPRLEKEAMRIRFLDAFELLRSEAGLPPRPLSTTVS